MVVREAEPSDAAEMSRVLIASITELCVADHGGDAAVIARWIANKSPEGIARWFATPANQMFVAVDDDAVLAVGGLRGDEIQLNYVAPWARFRGVSKAMLSHLEAALIEHGVTEARLSSTETAHRLYRSAGWEDRPSEETKFGVRSYPMKKSSVDREARGELPQCRL